MNLLIGISVVTFIAAVVVFILFFWRVRNIIKTSDDDDKKENELPQGQRGQARVCPLCAALFLHGETVHSKRFPKTAGRFERLLHIHGCKFCIGGERLRKCPVCGKVMGVDDYLIAHIYERPGKSHVHVQGCVHCAIRQR
jgi:hypothetical protein